jgi:[glutamine synthetase] adenylyltransferase / [glutamine synthetase]-adenylyl-L-tyrosine phosphorylase
MKFRGDSTGRIAIEGTGPAPRADEDFVFRMDPDYRSAHTPAEIRVHLEMSTGLNADVPVRLRITPRGKDRFKIVIVAYDYFSEFSILCGLVSSFDLDIENGNSYTFSDRPAGTRPTAPRQSRWARRIRREAEGGKKIVDEFEVRARPQSPFTEPRRREFETELGRLVRLLGENRIQSARERLNRRLVEGMEKRKGPFAGLVYPVEVRFDNRSDRKWTILDVHSRNTPAFLYAVSNALAMRNLYIHKVRIHSAHAEARDRFYISNRQGRKIQGQQEQKTLRIALVLIKHFTHFLPWAPDPAKAIRHFDQLLDKAMENKSTAPFTGWFKEKQGLDILAQLLGASDFLWEDFLRIQFENLLPVLESFKRRTRRADRKTFSRELANRLARGVSPEDKKRILNEYKDREMFSIDMRHLTQPRASLPDFSSALTDLAEAVVEQAYRMGVERLAPRFGRARLEDGTPCPFAICGLGKFGGREMGYASDIELLFVYGGPGKTDGLESVENSLYFERLCQETLHLIEARQEGIFHLDLRLRPDGNKGPLAVSLDRFRSYYHSAGEAAPFERQALTKLRFVAGDPALGRDVEAHRDRFVYAADPWDRSSALHLRQRQMTERSKAGTVNVKYGPGGLIDIEYAVQYLQVQHGHAHPGLRTPNTLEALERLRQRRLLPSKEHADLREAYRFLRTVIDGLRMVRGNAEDLVLPEEGSDEYKFLARRLGYHDPDWKKGARRLARDIRRRMERVHGIFRRRFPAPIDSISPARGIPIPGRAP